MHLDLYLDKCPGFGTGGAPAFNTNVVPLRNKRKRKNAEWSQPEWLFTFVFNNNNPTAYQQVLDMILLCRGRLHSFRARNPLFFNAQAWKFGYGDGTTTGFQLGRLVEGGGLSFLQQIHALSIEDDAPTPVFYVNGVAAAAAFNDRTGWVEFDVAPADDAVLTFSAYFDFWVEFRADDLPASIDNKSADGFVINYQVEAVESDPPEEAMS